MAIVAALLMALANATGAGAAPATGGAAATSASAGTEAPSAETPTAAEVPTAETPTATGTTEPVAKLTRAQIKRLQRKLRVVPADGVLGPRTRAAIRRFQARHHLTADGRPHLRVLALLRIPVRTPSTTTTAATTTAAAPASVQPAIEAAQAAIGAPYVSGATGPSSFDCSGLMVYAFAQAGITLPRTSFAQFEVGEEVALTEIQAGDLVFFDTDGPGASHVGIALGPGTAISATTHGVMEHPLTSGYWGEHLIGARRVG
ncbi:MAG TPA: NlpC/P60 family protein [Solirubrobacterales bacterium]|nr:NlpC/P60 family protein [Solirubrobacterales bacterium]